VKDPGKIDNISRVDSQQVFCEALCSPRADPRKTLEVLQERSDDRRPQIHQ
jgi:hypothetical protein